MRKNYIKIFSFILCLVMLLGTFLLVIGAEAEYTPVEWELDEKLQYIYGGTRRYDRYYVNGAFYGDADSIFYFMNGAYYNGSYCRVYGESEYPHIISVNTEPGYSCIFVDSEGKAILDSFLDRTNCIYYFEDFDVSYTKISEDLVEYLDASYNYKAEKLKTVNVAELGDADIFEITVHDQTETKAYQHGAIYIMPNGKYYYVCFEDLDNSYFDADGYFSYRMGSVPAYELDEKSRQNIDECIASMTPKLHKKIFEEDLIADNSYDYDYYDHLDPNFKFGSIVCFFAITIIVGIMIPAALIVLGIVFARSKKTNQAKCWYALSAAAALWLLSALLFLILVII